MVNIFVLLDVHFFIFDQDHSALVMILSAVVWRAEQCDQLTFGEKLVTILDNLKEIRLVTVALGTSLGSYVTV